ncbi:hypothetical protein FB451DRAFT_291435 [Mycena latifolia]|nr:hypothetical protein FB451DRAFT_291435 [Mycena latifolia]
MSFRVLVQAAVAVILLLSALIPTSQATTPPDPGATTCIRDAPPLTFDQSHWLWTAEMASGYGYIGTRAFRKTFVTPPGKTAVLAEIIMNGDDDFMLYVNGDTIGGASSWPDTKRFCMALRPDVNMFAATVHTAAQLVAGLLGTIQITYSDNSTTTIVTDSSWRVTTGAPAGFERPEFDDGAWPAASSFWQYPAGDWGAFFVPSAEKVECKNVKPDTCACKNDCKKATNPCSSFEDASCRPPIENGVQVCGPSITSTTECALKCNPGFESHGETCVPKCKPGLALDKEGTCVAETSEVFKDFCASGGFLSAVKGVGCKCLPEKTSEWCDDTVIGGGVRSCFSDAAATVVECRVSRCAGDPGTAPHVPIAPGTYQIQNKQTNIWLTNDVSAKQITVEAQENPPAATQVWKLEPQPGGSYHVSTTIGDETQYLYAPNGAPPVASTTQRTYFYIERRRPNAHFFMRPVDLCPVLVVENGQKLVDTFPSSRLYERLIHNEGEK